MRLVPCAEKRLQKIEIKKKAPIFFISDLHLCPQLPQTCAAFIKFVREVAGQAQALFILGDLFEYWIGDDALNDPHGLAQQVVGQLKDLEQRGTVVYLLPGNRDFLLGSRFACAAQAVLLDTVCQLQAFDQTIVLAHGDTLCIHDHRYQKFRRLAHQSWFQRCLLAAPIQWRKRLGQRLQRVNVQTEVLDSMYDVDTNAAQALLQTYQATALVHGHTHQGKPYLYNPGVRWVLPDWDMDQAKRAGYLCLDHQGMQLVWLN
jgi:UDP-2,3-diacylglucosamine hydrolase